MQTPTASAAPVAAFTSKLWGLSKNDVVKAIFVAVATPVAAYLGQTLSAFATGGSFAIDWTLMLHLAEAGFAGYLVKQFSTDSNGKLFGKIGGF